MALNNSWTDPGEPLLTSAPRVVLDTNVVLDWLLFGDPSMTALAAAVTQHRLCWIASLAMRDELEQVLGGLASKRGRDAAGVLGAWDRHVTRLPPAAPGHPLRCRDADDQMFVDLALGAGARWLVSRDRAVLALRTRAAGLGLRVLRPIDWTFE